MAGLAALGSERGAGLGNGGGGGRRACGSRDFQGAQIEVYWMQLWVCPQVPQQCRYWQRCPLVGRSPLRVSAAMVMLKYWDLLVEMDAGRLVKQAFLSSAALPRSWLVPIP